MLTVPEFWLSRPRVIVGLMSGTSLDGVDAVIIEVSGKIPTISWRMMQFATRAYTMEERARIAALLCRQVALPELPSANVWLGEIFADAALHIIAQAGLAPDQVDAIASHGQTIWHIPPQNSMPGATMQIGEPCVIAERTSILTVADFRPRDMAAGGQGAPLVPMADYMLFRNEDKNIAVQNIGGIGNVTWLPRGGRIEDTLAFDTGPGNMVIDAMVAHFGRGTYDHDGRMAAAGRIHSGLLSELLQHPYFDKRPPKSTGRELFGLTYAQQVLQRVSELGLTAEDAVATATALTVESIVRAYQNFLPQEPDEVVLGGGGSYNRYLREMLTACLPHATVVTHEDRNISGEAKEAIAFALLGHATLCGMPGNIPSATGARHPVILGKIIPGRTDRA